MQERDRQTWDGFFVGDGEEKMENLMKENPYN